MKHITIITSIARKEAISISRDKLSMLILLIMPALIVLMFGYALGFELKKTPFTVLDLDNTPMSQELVEHVHISPGFHFDGYLHHIEEIHESLIRGREKLVIAIPKGFSSQAALYKVPEIDLFIDATDPLMATAIENNLTNIFQDFSARQTERFTPVNLATDYKVSFLFNPELKNQVVPIPGLVMIILVLISAIMLSLSVNREKELGTNRLLMLTPARLHDIIAGKGIPYLVISLFHVFSIWMLSKWVFDIHVAGSAAMFILLCLVFIFNSMALGLLIAAWVRTELELLVGCWFFLFTPNLFLSGFIFPVSTMAEIIQPLAEISPGASFIEAYRGIVFRATGLADNAWSLTNLFIQGVLAYVLARIGFRRNYLKRT